MPRERSVSHPRSSNWTCGFPASSFPTGLIVRPTAVIQRQNSKTPKDQVTRESLGPAGGHLVPPTMGNTTATDPRSRRIQVGRRGGQIEERAGKLVAAHLRSLRPNRPTTLADHMPSSHRRYRDWTHERILREAAVIGDDTAPLVEIILRSRPHPEQGFRSCIGILGLAKRYDAERLDAACARALALGDAAKGSACEAGGMVEEGRAPTARSPRS